MTFEHLILETDDRGVATMTLNRPEVHNAFNEKLIAEITAAAEQLGADDTVRAVILRGAGKSFSAGGDLKWMQAAAKYTETENWNDALKLSGMLHALNFMPKPLIALVHGACMGGGVGLVSCADIAIATRDAKFALSEVRLGLIPAAISPYVIAAIGARQARRYFLSGERFTGTRAKSLGLIHETVGMQDDLDDWAGTTVKDLLAGGPYAVSAAKKLVFAVAGKDISQDLQQNTAERIAVRRASKEGQEGLAAFFEKRHPNWVPIESED